jgi:putative ABC transport system substrate-binding protein
VGIIAIGVGSVLCGSVTEAQQPKVYRIGAVHQGGPYKAIVDGLRDGLKESGLEEGKRFVLEVRETKGEIKLVEDAARSFERENVNLIYAVATAVTTVVKNVTSQIPVVFAVGSDPVASGLVQSFVKPGGRFTGVQYSTTDLTSKRLEILKEMLPKLGRIIIVYNPKNSIAVEAARLARQAGKQFGVQVTERHVNSVEELRQVLGALKAEEGDAFFYTSDSMVASQAQLVVSTTTAKNYRRCSRNRISLRWAVSPATARIFTRPVGFPPSMSRKL